MREDSRVYPGSVLHPAGISMSSKSLLRASALILDKMSHSHSMGRFTAFGFVATEEVGIAGLSDGSFL